MSTRDDRRERVHRAGERRFGRRATATVLALAAGAAVAAGVLRADELPEAPDTPRASTPSRAIRDQLVTEGVPFGPRENLEFAVSYGPVRAGTATLEVHGMKRYRGRLCYHFVSQARSASFFDRVYKVRNRIDTLVDAEDFVTWQYRKVQREGRYEADHEILYDHERNRARYADGQVLPFPEGALDAVGAFYVTRLQPLRVGTVFHVPHHSDKKTYYLEVRVVDRETIEVPAGRFDCWVVEPTVGDGGPFKQSGKMTIWLTADERRLPVLMKSKIAVGSIAASLERIVYGRAPTAARAGERASDPTGS